ncbi:helix-turn-helix transcriptional regulator [Paraburkholderia sp. Tr-20389]|uniref:helix-turn-helix domain-containing protein n=1 Tax=Paraburkholderia sp. Tr-20389 TaxID=2703903 RepID=UPI00197F013A|nr:AraC family transcriptional regulator [Paraburkholderia sp. Tr-20389]MBN3756154.1 helix-turn-helix transcriptional regulator [Paraburkholderia sp. Tr-20389]
MALTNRTDAASATIQPSAQPYWAGAWVEKFDNSSLRQLHRKTFAGLSVVFVDLQCEGPTSQDIRVDCGRLCVTLDERGGQMEGRVSASRRVSSRLDTMYPMSLTPAGMPFWAYSDTTRHVTFALFLFDYATVVPLIGEDVDVRALAEPRVMFFDERVLMLARLLALECNDSTKTDLLYGDSLSVALLLRLCRLDKLERAPQRTAIAPHRLQLAQDFMLTDLSTNVRLDDVASLIGLSPAHFSRAFKQCTGLSPHQWRLKERLEHACRMLIKSPHTIAQIAVSTGFSDQAHFTRVFRRLYGVTPAAWKREAR